MKSKTVAVLFARSDSIYKTMLSCDVFDKDRNALNFKGDRPVIAHPPCRSWGRLRHFAKPAAGEKELAIWAVEQVRKNGGVLEHPYASKLWDVANLPKPGHGKDEYGGWTLPVSQYWWGHKAEKKTLLYIVGCSPKEVPIIPLKLGYAEYTVTPSKTGKPYLRTADRERTPPDFAHWLVSLAHKCDLNSQHDEGHQHSNVSPTFAAGAPHHAEFSLAGCRNPALV